MKKDNDYKFLLTEQDSDLMHRKLFSDRSNGDWEHIAGWYIEDALAFIKRIFIASKFQAGIKLGGYGYWPLDKELTKWRASDGSPIKSSFVQLLCSHGNHDEVGEILLMGLNHIEENLIIPCRMDQAQLESREL